MREYYYRGLEEMGWKKRRLISTGFGPGLEGDFCERGKEPSSS
jgi:hypothetical protein